MLRKRNVSLCFYFVKMYWLKNSLRLLYTYFLRSCAHFNWSFFIPHSLNHVKKGEKSERKKERKKTTSLICFESWSDHNQGGATRNMAREGGSRYNGLHGEGPPIMGTFFSF